MNPSMEYGHHHRVRRKNGDWLVVSSSGEQYLEEVSKHYIMKRAGLPARDLRLLDPLLSYPSTILGRERAIVVNLGHIRAIITAAEVLIPNSKDPAVGPFLQDLRSKASSSDPRAMESNDVDGKAMAKATLCWPSFSGRGILRPQHATSTLRGGVPERSYVPASNSCREGVTKVLPFEFRALEVCLKSACRCLESETLTLEKEAYPTLDELTSKLSRLNLERVRQLKICLVAISGRVQKVRDELEHLLDDDMDMAEMYLSEKLARQQVGESSARGDNEGDEPKQDDDREDIRSEPESSHASLGGSKPNIEELEMLLEAYFVQIDGTLSKLLHLREYIDDTEDYINIMLDEKQNQLLQMGVMLSTATTVLTAGVVVVSIFGMNIHNISLYRALPNLKFFQTTFGTIAGIVGMYGIVIGWAKKSGFLQ